MPGNLAQLAHAALTAATTPGTGTVPAASVRPAGRGEAVVADTCVRDDLGFALLLHRRGDGRPAEELYFSTRGDDGSWTPADHLSGGVLGIDPTSGSEVAAVLRGRLLLPFGESETELFTGRPEAPEGYEALCFQQLLVGPEVDRLDVKSTAAAGASLPGRIRGPLASSVALFALFPGERLIVRPAVREEHRPVPPGEDEAHELTCRQRREGHGLGNTQSLRAAAPPLGNGRQ